MQVVHRVTNRASLGGRDSSACSPTLPLSFPRRATQEASGISAMRNRLHCDPVAGPTRGGGVERRLAAFKRSPSAPQRPSHQRLLIARITVEPRAHPHADVGAGHCCCLRRPSASPGSQSKVTDLGDLRPSRGPPSFHNRTMLLTIPQVLSGYESKRHQSD